MPAKIINVLVHGLFFMRLSDDGLGLDLIAPRLTGESWDHKFVVGVRAKAQQLPAPLLGAQVPATSVNWRNIGLEGKDAPRLMAGAMPADVQPSNLQFSLTESGLKAWNPAAFAAVVSLPWPLGFYSVRCDFYDRVFLYDATKGSHNIWDKITKYCRGSNLNAKVGLATCLRYEYQDSVNVPGWRPDTNLHCYYEPCTKDDIDHVNTDLRAAAQCFLNADAFDLQIDKGVEGRYTARGELCPAKAGVDPEDDYCLCEDPLVRKLICPPKEQIDNVHPANCPNFFVGP